MNRERKKTCCDPNQTSPNDVWFGQRDSSSERRRDTLQSLIVTVHFPPAFDTPDASLNEAANRKLNKYRNHYANNHSISFLPAITSTPARMHGECLRLLFLQAHRETEAYFAFMGEPVQPDQDQFGFRRATFYSSLKSKVGLIAAKAAALRVNMNTDSCLIASHAAPRHLRLSCSHVLDPDTALLS